MGVRHFWGEPVNSSPLFNQHSSNAQSWSPFFLFLQIRFCFLEVALFHQGLWVRGARFHAKLEPCHNGFVLCLLWAAPFPQHFRGLLQMPGHYRLPWVSQAYSKLLLAFSSRTSSRIFFLRGKLGSSVLVESVLGGIVVTYLDPVF